MRLNVLASLANPETVLRDVRSVNFVSTGSHARLSVRDVLVAMSRASFLLRWSRYPDSGRD